MLSYLKIFSLLKLDLTVEFTVNVMVIREQVY